MLIIASRVELSRAIDEDVACAESTCCCDSGVCR